MINEAGAKQAELQKLTTTLKSARDGLFDINGLISFVESLALKTALEKAKRENERLRSSSTASNTAASGLQRHHLISSLPPQMRRTWYEGEWHLFERRLGIVKDVPSVCIPDAATPVPFLTCADIPWPLSPTLPTSTDVSTQLMLSFLFSDLSAQATVPYAQSLISRFRRDKARAWLPSVVVRERDQVLRRAQEVETCLRALCDGC